MESATSARYVWLMIAFFVSASGRRLSAQTGTSETATPPVASRTAPQTSHSLTDEERADLFMAHKSYDDAVDYYYRALKQQGFKSAVLWNKMGIAYQEEGNFRQARKDYKKSVHLDAHYAEALNNLGTTYFLQKKPKKSVKYYVRAIKLKPAIASFHLNLGSAYYRMKKYKGAVEQFRAALTLDPEILMQRSRTATVLETASADADYYFYLAKVFASLGRPQEAVRYLRHAMEDGFKNRKKILEDPDFKKISGDPGYISLLKNPPVPIPN